MGLAASVNVGNKTLNTVTNSTVNTQAFTVDNCVKITNALHQAATVIAESSNRYNSVLKEENINRISIGSIVLSGKGTSLKLNQELTTNAKLNAKMVADSVARLDCSTDATDTTLFQMTTDESSKQKAASSVDSAAGMETECTSGGLFTASVAVGVGNSVHTDVNQSISNCFSAAVSNYMSSETNRSNMATSITLAQNVVKQVRENKNMNDLVINTIKASDGAEVEVTQSALSNYTSSIDQLVTLETRVDSSVTAITHSQANATSSIDAEQEAKVTTVATASMSNKTAVSSVGAVLIVLVALIIGGRAALTGGSDEKKDEKKKDE